ncbi:type II toxin-antitoxin system VapB family antitoxin [Modestobacter lapidis]|nr:type II toxin-antitoxin system VapB family antitoxin [Modestobacter lapidis]
MALSIKTTEADALARELAAATHETLTAAVTTALRERLARVRAQEDDVPARLARLAAEYAAMSVVDRRSAEEIVGYDSAGLPG